MWGDAQAPAKVAGAALRQAREGSPVRLSRPRAVRRKSIIHTEKKVFGGSREVGPVLFLDFGVATILLFLCCNCPKAGGSDEGDKSYMSLVIMTMVLFCAGLGQPQPRPSWAGFS